MNADLRNHGNPLARPDTWLVAAALPAIAWGAWLAWRTVQVEGKLRPAGEGAVAATGVDGGVGGAALPDAGGKAGGAAGAAAANREDAARLATLVAAFDRRLDALAERIAAARRARGEQPDAARDADEALLAKLDTAAANAQGAQLGRMAAWMAPFAAEEALDELARELALSPEQRPAAERALRGYFTAWFERLATTFGGGDPVAAGADPRWRDLAEGLERDLRGVLSPEQFGRFVAYRERRQGGKGK